MSSLTFAATPLFLLPLGLVSGQRPGRLAVVGTLVGLVGIAGIVFGVLGQTWGWALLAGAVVYFAFSVLGLEIIARAEETGVLQEL